MNNKTLAHLNGNQLKMFWKDKSGNNVRLENSHASIFNKSDGKASNPRTHHIYDIGRRNLIYINCTGRVEKSGLLPLSLFMEKR